MTNIKLTIEYDGSQFYGWQIQDGLRTIQAEIRKAVTSLVGEDCKVRVAGRTDAGVHALGQVANFYTSSTIPPEKFAPALNQYLPRDICIKSSQKVDNSFDATRDSLWKEYVYRIYNSSIPSALERYRAWQVRSHLHVADMIAGSKYFLGEHDFESFRSAHCDAQHAIRRIDDITIKSYAIEKNNKGQLIVISIKGNAFCRNMVRIMVGTLMEVGRGYRQVEDIVHILKAKDRTVAGVTAPPQGLFLAQVMY